ncbi:MAG: peptidoglycan DD-metalloendopeptidase family protein [Thermoleophilaceae bacterium]|nr:peptidoglycan DD-metalloendopeptidase family protein [Thermoleophilaceae bacterium]
MSKSPHTRGAQFPGMIRRGRLVPHALVLVIAAAAAMLLATPMGSSAKSASELQQDISRKRAKEGALTGDIQTLSEKVRGLRGRVGVLEKKQSSIEGALNQQIARQQRVARALQVSQKRLVSLKRRLKRSKAVLAARIVAVYKAGDPTILTVVLESNGFAEMVERTTYLREIAKQDHRIISAVVGLKGQTKRETVKLAGLESEATRLVASTRERRDQVATSKNVLAEKRDGLSMAVRGRKSVLARVSKSRRDDEDALKAMNRSSAAVQDVLSTAPGPIKRGTGRFIYPINGQFVSPFGMRWGRLHAGIDLAAPAGTPIRAADGGTVRYAGWMDGYGNYTCVQHTGSLSTCYAHQSSIGVSVGQSVKQGAVIGKVGNTGNSFGNHVHFEVRVNGNPVDPMGYL